MSEFGICGKNFQNENSVSTVRIQDREFHVINIEIENENENEIDEVKVPAGFALLKCLAFSLNYRDLSVIDEVCDELGDDDVMPIGSEYVAEIIKVNDVTNTYYSGQKVLLDYQYYGQFWSSKINHGVISDHSSRKYSLIETKCLVSMPKNMPLEQAAAFTISSQTAYSMVRRAQLKPGDHALVFSTSSTSISVIKKLNIMNVKVCLVTSKDTQEVTEHLKVEQVINNKNIAVELNQYCQSNGGFNAVFDPFFDLNVLTGFSYLQPFSTYVTCGILEQSDLTDTVQEKVSMEDLFIYGLANNINLVFNCIGLREDLEHAIFDYEHNDYQIIIDSFFSKGQESEFLEHTFSRNKFGKVAYLY